MKNETNEVWGESQKGKNDWRLEIRMVICEGEIPGQGGENGNLVRPEFSFEGGSKRGKKRIFKIL